MLGTYSVVLAHQEGTGMAELPSDAEQGATPENTGTLYSLAQAQVTRYWDFSASRKQVRGQFHPVVQPLHQAREMPVSEAVAQPLSPTGETTPRWHALHSVFAAPEPVAPPVIQQHPPTVAVFSMAGGVGKTCLVATLGRALSALGEHVLLADTTTGGLLPFYFGARASNPGVVRTFSPIGVERDAPVKVLNLEAERYPASGGEHDPLLAELASDGDVASRILVDLATAGRDVIGRLLVLQPTVLVPLLPDLSSVASLGSLEAFFGQDDGVAHYLLNQFDGASSLHRDVREMLQHRLGDRLLPLVLRRSVAVSEALAEGMTVIDYAPGSATAEDYWNLAGWLRSLSAPAARGRSGVRWTER
jgi:cellulose synthase operon protein YhjQ